MKNKNKQNNKNKQTPFSRIQNTENKEKNNALVKIDQSESINLITDHTTIIDKKKLNKK